MSTGYVVVPWRALSKSPWQIRTDMMVTMGTNEKLQEILPRKEGMKAEKRLSAAVQCS